MTGFVHLVRILMAIKVENPKRRFMKSFHYKINNCIMLCMSLCSCLVGQQPIEILDQYIQTALDNNSAVKHSFSVWKSEESKIATAKGLPNPTVSFGYFLENVETAAGPQEYKIGLNQKIPFFGKRTHTSRIQSAQSKKAYYLYQKRQLVIIDKVRSTWLDTYYLSKLTDLTQQNFDLVKNWDSVIRSKYITSRTSHPDLVKTQIELIQLEDDLRSLENRKKPILEKFRSLLNQDSLAEIVVPDSLTAVVSPIEREILIQKMEKSNSDLKMAEVEIEKRKLQVKLSKLNRMPDVAIGVEKIGTGEKVGSPFSGKDPLVAKVSLDLPIWFGKNKSTIQSASYEKNAAEDHFNTTRNELEVQLEKVIYDLEESSRQIQLYRDLLIPKGLESLGVTEIAYRTDKIDFIALVDAQRRLLQFQMKYEKAVVDYLKAQSRLSLLTGELL